VPVLSGTTNVDGLITLGLGAPTAVTIGGGSCYPTTYVVNGTGSLFPRNIFTNFSSSTIPLEGAELLTIETEMGEAQRSGRGMVAVVASTSLPGVPTEVQINRVGATPIGFDSARPFTAPGDPRLGFGASRVVIFGNVEPGPLDVNVGGCVVDDSAGRVFAGSLTVVSVDCAGG
jgi:hypothetical protein